MGESRGKEKAQKSAEAVAKTAKYEKKIKSELQAKKDKHDKIVEMQTKAKELSEKHPKKPDVDEKLEKSTEKVFKSHSTHKEENAKWEIKLKKQVSDSDEMKEKNDAFNKAEKNTKSAEASCKKEDAEASTKAEKGSKESSSKLASRGHEGSNKVDAVEAKEQKTKEKHAKDPFYHLDVYAKKVANMHEVFDKTKAAYERKCKSKAQEIQMKADYALKSEEATQEKTTKEKVEKVEGAAEMLEKATNERCDKVEGAAEMLEKATNERCDKTTKSSELSDKFETKKWSAELDDLKKQCKSAQKSEEKEQKAFTVQICSAAHAHMEDAADGIGSDDSDDSDSSDSSDSDSYGYGK